MLAVVNIPWIHKSAGNGSHEGALYAALECIQTGNPALAQALHDSKAPPPYSAMLSEGVLRVGALNREVFLALNRSKLAHRADMTAATTMPELLAEAGEMPLTLRLEFASPTSFGRDGMSHILPELGSLFGSLAQRWEECGGAAAPVRFGREVVTYVNLRTQKVKVGGYFTWGFVGKLTVKLTADTAVWGNALALFGEYAGVGQRTTQGFGQLRVLRPS